MHNHKEPRNHHTQHFFDESSPGATPGGGDCAMTRRDYLLRIRARSIVIDDVFLFLLCEQN